MIAASFILRELYPLIADGYMVSPRIFIDA